MTGDFWQQALAAEERGWRCSLAVRVAEAGAVPCSCMA